MFFCVVPRLVIVLRSYSTQWQWEGAGAKKETRINKSKKQNTGLCSKTESCSLPSKDKNQGVGFMIFLIFFMLYQNFSPLFFDYHRFHYFHCLSDSSCFFISHVLHFSLLRFSIIFIILHNVQHLASSFNIVVTFHQVPVFLIISHIFAAFFMFACRASCFIIFIVFMILHYFSSSRSRSCKSLHGVHPLDADGLLDMWHVLIFSRPLHGSA